MYGILYFGGFFFCVCRVVHPFIHFQFSMYVCGTLCIIEKLFGEKETESEKQKWRKGEKGRKSGGEQRFFTLYCQIYSEHTVKVN